MLCLISPKAQSGPGLAQVPLKNKTKKRFMMPLLSYATAL